MFELIKMTKCCRFSLCCIIVTTYEYMYENALDKFLMPIVLLLKNLPYVLLQEASTNTIQTSFADADVFVVCYSSVQPKSFENVKDKWLPRIRDYLGDIPLVLVATQTDLRNNSIVIRQLKKDGLKPVSTEEGHAFSKRIDCACYVETSPSMERRMKNVMNKAISSVLLPQPDRSEITLCTIL